MGIFSFACRKPFFDSSEALNAWVRLRSCIAVSPNAVYTNHVMEIAMSDIVEILERELESAVEVKDKGALHRYVALLVASLVSRKQHETAASGLNSELGALRSDVVLIAERMEQGFTRMDKRFGDIQATMDQRFGDIQATMDQRFGDLQATMDQRFGDIQATMDRRFADTQHNLDKRFGEQQTTIDKRFNLLAGMTSTFFVVLAAMMTAMRIFG